MTALRVFIGWHDLPSDRPEMAKQYMAMMPNANGLIKKAATVEVEIGGLAPRIRSVPPLSDDERNVFHLALAIAMSCRPDLCSEHPECARIEIGPADPDGRWVFVALDAAKRWAEVLLDFDPVAFDNLVHMDAEWRP